MPSRVWDVIMFNESIFGFVCTEMVRKKMLVMECPDRKYNSPTQVDGLYAEAEDYS